MLPSLPLTLVRLPTPDQRPCPAAVQAIPMCGSTRACGRIAPFPMPRTETGYQQGHGASVKP